MKKLTDKHLGCFVLQFGGLFLRRQRKIRRIRNGVSRMPSGFDKPSDLPFYYNEKSQAERANDELREEMLRVRGEIDSLKSMLSTRLQDTGSRSTGGSDQGPSRTQTLRGRLFGRRRKTTENKSKLDPSTPMQSSNLLGSAVHFALADMQTSGNQLGNAANFAPEIGRDRSVDVPSLASGSSRTMRKALSGPTRPTPPTRLMYMDAGGPHHAGGLELGQSVRTADVGTPLPDPTSTSMQSRMYGMYEGGAMASPMECNGSE